MSALDVREEPVLLTSEPAATARGRAGVSRRAGPTRALAGPAARSGPGRPDPARPAGADRAAGPGLAPYPPNEQIPAPTCCGPAARTCSAPTTSTATCSPGTLLRHPHRPRRSCSSPCRSARCSAPRPRCSAPWWASSTSPLQRVFDVVLAFPTLILAIGLDRGDRPGHRRPVIIVIAVLETPGLRPAAAELDPEGPRAAVRRDGRGHRCRPLVGAAPPHPAQRRRAAARAAGAVLVAGGVRGERDELHRHRRPAAARRRSAALIADVDRLRWTATRLRASDR